MSVPKFDKPLFNMVYDPIAQIRTYSWNALYKRYDNLPAGHKITADDYNEEHTAQAQHQNYLTDTFAELFNRKYDNTASVLEDVVANTVRKEFGVKDTFLKKLVEDDWEEDADGNYTHVVDSSEHALWGNAQTPVCVEATLFLKEPETDKILITQQCYIELEEDTTETPTKFNNKVTAYIDKSFYDNYTEVVLVICPSTNYLQQISGTMDANNVTGLATIAKTGKYLNILDENNSTDKAIALFNNFERKTTPVTIADIPNIGAPGWYTKLALGAMGARLIENKQGALVALQSALLDMVYPVGSIYCSVSSTNPQNFLGGTWKALHGVMLMAEGNNGDGAIYYVSTSSNKDGGYKDAYVIEHEHAIKIATKNGSWIGNSGAMLGEYNNYCIDEAIASSLGVIDHSYPARFNVPHVEGCKAGITSSQGISGINRNIPPYKAVYMWQRTA